MQWSTVSSVFLAACVSAGPALAQTVDAVARSYREHPSVNSRAALTRFAAAHPKDQEGALAALALAQGSLQDGKYQEALDAFVALVPRLPEVADFARYGAAQALVNLGRKGEAIVQYEAVATHNPVSSLMPWAVLAAGSLHLEAGAGEPALRLATLYLKQLPSPQGLFLYASALEAVGRHDRAAMEFSKVFYEYPRSAEAAKAEPILARLQSAPPVPAALVLARARALMKGGDGRKAIVELQRDSGNFIPADKDMALTLVGVSRFYLRDRAGALTYLKALKVDPAGEADAERLLYIVESARRVEKYGDVDAALDQLAARHRKSHARLEALSAATTRFLFANDQRGIEPVLEACSEFVPEPEAASCHWKLTWNHYQRKLADAPSLLRQHVERFPGSEDVAAAMYFLGRVSERDGNLGDAKAYYQTVARRFPNFYYGVVSRDRLRTPALVRAGLTSPAVSAFLKSVPVAPPGQIADFEMDAATRLRIKRAELLTKAASDDQARSELRFAMRNGAKATLCGMELARMAQARGENGQALRAIKGSVQGYLTWRFEDAPLEFWQLAYPLPYREPLEKYAAGVEVDPFVVAGLIRQESEFDPGAISRANARGLTQVLPTTGREVSRRLGIRPFNVSLLHDPDSSLRIGITYLKQMLNSFGNKWFLTLAAYNAGPGRANMWLKWGDFEEAAEFIETIPFTETRGYVQTVLRNADLYRRIWGTTSAARAAVAAAADSGDN